MEVLHTLIAYSADVQINERYKDPRPFHLIPTTTYYDDATKTSISIDGCWFGRRDGDTPLLILARSAFQSTCYATHADTLMCAKTLLAAGADAHMRSTEGLTAADIAYEYLDEQSKAALWALEAPRGGAPTQP